MLNADRDRKLLRAMTRYQRYRTRRDPLSRLQCLRGAGAKVLGPVRIGAGARVGTNPVVFQDVPLGATAIGIPARIAYLENSIATDLITSGSGS